VFFSENRANMDDESGGHNKPEKSILHNQRSNLQSLSLKDMREVTNDFSDERLLGQGGFGRVYKGVLANGDTIAVKKLTWTTSGLQDKQYENEAGHLMSLKHPNIVQLVGYCSETENELVQLPNGKYVYAEKPKRLLCLEYMPNGSLCKHLSGMTTQHHGCIVFFFSFIESFKHQISIYVVKILFTYYPENNHM